MSTTAIDIDEHNQRIGECQDYHLNPISVHGNVQYAQERLTKEHTEAYGFLWEKAIWLYFILVLDEKGYRLEYNVDGDEIDQIPVRSNLRDEKNLTVNAYPPSQTESPKKAPLSFSWLGGVGEVDFSLSIPDSAYYVLEAKSSTNHSCGSKHPKCDCVIETDKIRPLLTALDEDHLVTGIILHLHGNFIGNQRTRTKAAKVTQEMRFKKRSFSISKHTSVERWIEKTIPQITSDIKQEQ